MRANEAVRFGLGRSCDSEAIPKRFRSGFGASARCRLQNEVRQAMWREVKPPRRRGASVGVAREIKGIKSPRHLREQLRVWARVAPRPRPSQDDEESC